MCIAFSSLIDEFQLVSTKNQLNTDKSECFLWEKIGLKTTYKHSEFIFRSWLYVRKNLPTHVYTRDIVVAFFFSFFKISVAYEAHKDPKNIISKILIILLKKKKNFKLVLISKALSSFYKNIYKYPKNKLFAYHDAVFIEKYDKIRGTLKNKLRSNLNLPIDKLLVIHTGSLTKDRGGLLFESILKEYSNVFFIHVGGSLFDIDKFKNVYSNYENIEFIPHQDNEKLVEYQMSADLLFYSITKEVDTYWCCSPMKIFEYMATGVPILGSNIGSISEVLNPSNSIIFDPENQKTIGSGFRYFTNNRVESKKKSDAALLEVRHLYTWSVRAKSILEFIK